MSGVLNRLINRLIIFDQIGIKVSCVSIKRVYDVKFAAFDGEVSTDKNTYNILLPGFAVTEQAEAETRAIQVAQWLDQHLAAVKGFAASQLISLKNTNWLEEGELTITEAEFISTIDLEGITA